MSDYQVSLPTKPRIVEESDTRGIYEIDGFYPGYGHTIGNSLRRIILSSLPGVAITSVKIEGVNHEFSTIEGVEEDVIRILLNLKKLRLKATSTGEHMLKLSIKGSKTVTAADIVAPGQVEILNKDQHIAEVTGKTSLNIEFKVETGLGYVPKEALNKEKVDIGSIALDAAFAPIKRVNYEVENMRVGDRTDYNRLRIFIETDGTLTAHEALEKSIEIMIHQLKSIIGFKEEEPEIEEVVDEAAVDSADTVESTQSTGKSNIDTAEVFKTRIEELKLSQRIDAAMSDAGIRTIGGLVRKREEDLLAIQGLGQKGLQEIKRALSNYGVTLRA